MKKTTLLLILTLLCTFTVMAQDNSPSITLTTTSASELSLTVAPVPEATVYIDWGDGTRDNGSPNWDNSRITFSGKAKGDRIVIHGSTKEVDFASDSYTNNQLTSINIVEQTKLEQLNIKGNNVSELILQNLPVLTTIDIRDNQIKHLDISGLPELKYLTATNNKLIQVQIGENNKLEQMDLSLNDISTLAFAHTLPKLSLLNVEGNAILTLDLAKVPALEDLNINGNAFQTIDLTSLTGLTKLFAKANYLSSINLSKNKALQSVDLSSNRLRKINLMDNTKLTRLNLSENMLTEVVVSTQPILLDLNVRKNEQLYHLDLSKNTKLRTINADSTAIEGLDLNTNYNVTRVYLRGTRLSPYALNYLFSTLPDMTQNPTGYTNIYLAYTSWKGADLSILSEKHWKSDLAPDADPGTLVPRDVVDVKLELGDNGTVSALFGGEELVFPQRVPKGGIVHLDILPAEGYELDYIKREVEEDGKTILLPVYGRGVIIEGNTTIHIAFRKKDERIVSFVTSLPIGTDIALKLRQTADASTDNVLIDWGNGEWIEQSVTKEATSTTVVEGQIAGTNVRILGPLDKIGADEMGITSVDLTHNPSLIVIDLYGNALTEIDLTKNVALANLSIGLNKLKHIDLTNNKQLEKLSIRGNKEIEQLDLSQNKILVQLDAKNLALTAIALSSPDLIELDLQGNKLKSIDFASSPKIETVRLANNLFESLDLSPLAGLKLLNVGNNRLSNITVDKHVLLERLYINDNPLKSLRFAPAQTKLIYIDMADCTLDACQLDSTYHSLPIWQGSPNQTVPVTLYNQGLSPQANQASTSKTKIATEKGWKLTALGDGSGCNNDLSTAQIITPGHGFNYYDTQGILHVVVAPGIDAGILRLYDLGGKLICQENAQEEYRIPLSTGTYILHLGGKAFKIFVH